MVKFSLYGGEDISPVYFILTVIGYILYNKGRIIIGRDIVPVKGQVYVKEFIEHYRERLVHMWETQEFEVLPAIR